VKRFLSSLVIGISIYVLLTYAWPAFTSAVLNLQWYQEHARQFLFSSIILMIFFLLTAAIYEYTIFRRHINSYAVHKFLIIIGVLFFLLAIALLNDIR